VYKRQLHGIAERVSTTTLSWQDVILPNDILGQLMDIVTYGRYSQHVFEEWGFGTKMPYGRSNSSLLSGPPGTGKTMAASLIARELGMDLFRVDLSQIVSKYVGETEKNLGRVFDEATRTRAVLLFDEADALFAKRTSVKSSHDRYANLEVNYLLQRIEQYDGATILTTNFPGNIDEAFIRRIKFKIDFPFPEEEEREALWKVMLPPNAEIDPDIDFEKLGVNFELSGGSIKNAIIRAAFKAAEAGCPINMDLLTDAGRQESREMGHLVREELF